MPYSTRRHYAKNPPLSRLYKTTQVKGVHFYERPSPDSPTVGMLYGRTLFHGSPAVNERWVRRLPSEGGGFAYTGVVEEVI